MLGTFPYTLDFPVTISSIHCRNQSLVSSIFSSNQKSMHLVSIRDEE
ncbi:unnamed protein product [Amoebophrya sp. A25]|nr:unnamed protein product [Amoebophrya sp. A25]|eukprot:GSA25T00003235001.1